MRHKKQEKEWEEMRKTGKLNYLSMVDRIEIFYEEDINKTAPKCKPKEPAFNAAKKAMKYCPPANLDEIDPEG